MALSRLHRQILEELPHLPGSAPIPLPVAEVVEGLCSRTIKETYPLVRIGERKQAVLKKHLRGAGETVTA